MRLKHIYQHTLLLHRVTHDAFFCCFKVEIITQKKSPSTATDLKCLSVLNVALKIFIY